MFDKHIIEQEENNQIDFDQNYKNFIDDATPWFAAETIICIIDLPNINMIATGDYNKKICLWDLRAANYHEQMKSIQLEMINAEKSK